MRNLSHLTDFVALLFGVWVQMLQYPENNHITVTIRVSTQCLQGPQVGSDSIDHIEKSVWIGSRQSPEIEYLLQVGMYEQSGIVPPLNEHVNGHLVVRVGELEITDLSSCLAGEALS